MFNETSHNDLQHFAQKFLLNVPEDIYIMKNLSSDRAVKYNLHFIASFIWGGGGGGGNWYRHWIQVIPTDLQPT